MCLNNVLIILNKDKLIVSSLYLMKDYRVKLFEISGRTRLIYSYNLTKETYLYKKLNLDKGKFKVTVSGKNFRAFKTIQIN